MSQNQEPLVFISYKHSDYSTAIARKLRAALEVVSDGLGFRVFLDDEDLRAADEWQKLINEAMGEMTHFVALLTDEYLLKRSTECRRELLEAVSRYENGGKTKLLFVLVDDIDPGLIDLGADRKAGRLISDDPRILNLGKINFLGPYNDAKQLVRLKWESPSEMRDQIKQLIDHFQRTLPEKAV